MTASDTRLSSRLERYRHFDSVNRPYLEWQLSCFRPFLGRRVLEVGCGLGTNLELLAPRELSFGIDVDAAVLDFARARFAGRQDAGFALADIARLEEPLRQRLRDQAFDSIVCLNVLEHVLDDLAAARTLFELLAPGGTLALLVPAHAWLYGPYDALDGHHRRYSVRQVRALLEAAGFAVSWSHYFNAVGALGWWVQYKLLRRSIHGEGSFGLMNRLVPLMRRLERLLRPPFGLSVVALGRKGA